MSDEAQNQARSRSMMRESGKLSALTMLSRVLGLLREITRTTLLGTSALGESFTVAFATPNLFRRLLAEGVMSTALIPTMKTYFDGEDEAETRTFLSAAFTALMFVT
ncbi:MAG: murein biosynthesis integral membrane protein MurJ, partial [Spirochaetes bacterium]|nr:murein biosynthesis integral membrane protein MurJ [Spirochaetota bacterium]